MNEVVKLHAIIKWGLYRKEMYVKGETSLRKIVLSLLNEIDFSKITNEDIAKYIEPYDIFESEEYHSLLVNRVSIFTFYAMWEYLKYLLHFERILVLRIYEFYSVLERSEHCLEYIGLWSAFRAFLRIFKFLQPFQHIYFLYSTHFTTFQLTKPKLQSTLIYPKTNAALSQIAGLKAIHPERQSYRICNYPSCLYLNPHSPDTISRKGKE